MSTKLTKAQLRELKEMSGRAYRSYYADSYKPVQRLYDLGLVSKQIDRWGSSTFAILPDGVQALAEAKAS